MTTPAGRRSPSVYGRAACAASMLAAVAALAVAPSRAQTLAPEVTQSRPVTPLHPVVRSHGSPAVVVDPDDPRQVFAAGAEFRSGACSFLRSQDGGMNWRPSEHPPSVPGYPMCMHNLGQMPVAALGIGRDKTLYWAHVVSSMEDTPNLSVFLARSVDGGETWTTSAVRDARGKRGTEAERNIVTDVAVDTTTGTRDVVYVTWMRALPLVTPPQARQARVAVSVDGGTTFSDPVDPADSFFREPGNLPPDVTVERRQAGQIGGLQPNLALDTTGNLYVAWLEFAIGDPFHSPVRWRRMYVSRSVDGGRTFGDHGLVRAMTTDGVGLIGPMLEWSPRGGPEGSLHLVYESRKEPAQGDRDVQHQRSVDGGRTWSEVKALNDDDPKQLYGQFLPNVAVAPSGRVDVAWWDLRDGAARYATDVYYSSSEDAGATWSRNLRVTDRSIDRTIGIWTDNSDTRQPPGLGSADELAVVVWDDTRQGDHLTDTQDLRAAAMQFEPVGGSGGIGQRMLAYGLAGLAGAGAVGAILLVAGLVIRSRRAQPTLDPETPRPLLR